MRKLSSYLMITVKGICMGAADVIPGVSGGTIAFLMGIYEEFVNSIKSIDLKAVKLLFSGKFREFWQKINGNFLISLLIGILISIFSLAKLMQYLLENYPIPLWSFFFGLIIASAIYILKGVKGWKISDFFSLIVGIGIGIAICLLSPSNTPETWWFIMLSGAIAICAMILPGISGSFILLLLGKYAFMMDAVSSLNMAVLSLFIIGALIGIISFSHLLSWLLKKFYNGTIVLLAGMMIGSLLKVWPWKHVLPSGVDRPLLPFGEHNYQIVTGFDPQILQAVIFGLIGLALVFVIEFLSVSMKRKK